MSRILIPILRSWQSERRGDPDHVLTQYVEHPDTLACTVALTPEGKLQGYQSLRSAGKTNDYDVPDDWGIIGTYVSLCSGRQGIGTLLFSKTLEAVRTARLARIDATIGKTNFAGRAYYAAMGFKTWRDLPTAIGKCLVVSPQTS